MESADPATRRRGGFDVAFECSGATLRTAVAAVRREATVVTIGLLREPFPLAVTDTLITRGITLRGSWGRSIWASRERLAELVVAGRADLASLVTPGCRWAGWPTRRR